MTRPAKGHIPFPHHRTQAEVRADEERVKLENEWAGALTEHKRHEAVTLERVLEESRVRSEAA